MLALFPLTPSGPNVLRAPQSQILALTSTFMERRHHDFGLCLSFSFSS